MSSDGHRLGTGAIRGVQRLPRRSMHGGSGVTDCCRPDGVVASAARSDEGPRGDDRARLSGCRHGLGDAAATTTDAKGESCSS